MDKLFSSASSLFSSSSADDDSAPPSSHHAPSNETPHGDLSSSAQILMNAAKSKFSHDQSSSGEEVDMGSLAGATSNVLGFAVQYGKLDGTSYGQYANKAEEYLQSYSSKHGHSAATHSAGQGERYPTSEQGHHLPTAHQEPSYGQDTPQGYSESEQGYPEDEQGRRTAASHAYRQEETNQGRRQEESEEYSQGYSPDEYPESGRRPTRYS